MGGGFPYPYYSHGDEIELIANALDVSMLETTDSGTRYASSLAASAAALVLSYRPSWTNTQIRGLLHATATPLLESDYEWASKEHSGLTYCRGYGEVDAFDALRIADYSHDWWSKEEEISEPAEIVGFDRYERPDVAIDRHGNSHVVWFQLQPNFKYEIVYNAFTSRGEKIYHQDICLDPGVWTCEFVDVEVDSGDNVYAIWCQPDRGRGTIQYTKLQRGQVLVETKTIYSPLSPFIEPRYTNLMISEHPSGKAQIIFTVAKLNHHKILYLDVDSQGNPGNAVQIYPKIGEDPDNKIHTRHPSADLARVKFAEGQYEDRIMYVYEEEIIRPGNPDDYDVFWNSYIPSQSKNYLDEPLLLRGPVKLDDDQERYDWEICPNIDVDLTTAYSYIIWKRRNQVIPGNDDWDHDVLEYTWLDASGADLTGWTEEGEGTAANEYGNPYKFPYKHRVSQIGEPSDHDDGQQGYTWGSYYGGGQRQKMFPVISYNSHSAKWDQIGYQGTPLAYSTIAWSEKTDDGWGIYYTHVLPNGREFLPDTNPNDKALTGQTILFSDTFNHYQGFPSIDSQFETEGIVLDNSGNINIIWGEPQGHLLFVTSRENWKNNENLVDDAEQPDIAVDSDDDFHVIWEEEDSSTQVTEVKYGSWRNDNQVPPNTIQNFGPLHASNRLDGIPSKKPLLQTTQEGENEKVHIFWIEENGLEEIWYRRYDVEGNPEIVPVRAAFFPQNRQGFTSFIVLSMELAYDEERQKIHVVYSAEYQIQGQMPFKYQVFHGSINLNNVVFHSEAMIGPQPMNNLNIETTAAIDIGPDSMPFVVYSAAENIYFQRLNWNPGGERTVGYRDKIDDRGQNIDSYLPNILVDRDTIRRTQSIIDWDIPDDNDRFIHIVFYGCGGPGIGFTHLYYTKLNSEGDFIIEQKQITVGLLTGITNIDFPDMIIESDNRLGVVAYGDSPSGSWMDVPDSMAYYIKLDNNGEIITAQTLMNVIEPFLIGGQYSGMYTCDEYLNPKITVNNENEIHMVFEIVEGDPPTKNIYHTRHYL